MGIHGLLLLVICAVILHLSTYVFHADDDFCFIHDIRNSQGLNDYLYFWWSQWSGRWFGTLARYIYYTLVGFTASAWIVPIFLGSIIVGTVFSVRALYGQGSNVIAMGLVAAIVFLLGMSHPENMLFWAPAGFDYTIGYLFLGLFGYCLAKIGENKDLNCWPYVFMGSVSAVFACGLSEIQALLPPAITLCLVLLAPVRYRGLVAAVLGAALNLLAPGPQLRQSTSGIDIELLHIVRNSLLYGFRQLIIYLLIIIFYLLASSS